MRAYARRSVPRPIESYLPAHLQTAARREQLLWEGAEQASEFFMGTSDVHATLARLVQALNAANIPYAIAGAMAFKAYGYRRQTVNVDLLVTENGLKALKAVVLGRGLVEKFA